MNRITYLRLKKTISLITLIAFLSTNVAYAAPSSRSFFKNKKIDYKKLSTQRRESLQQKESVLQGKDGTKKAHHRKQTQRVFATHLKDLSQIHIPQELGRVIEVYEADNREPITENRLIVHIQDLHTNPEAQFNLAKILELLKKDYALDLVLSEGADGKVDTSSVSSFPDYSVREKVVKLFVDSGELTGEEYLSITKYPNLPIWGIEDRDIYFQNIIDFNRIMKFSSSSQVFIKQAKKVLEELKSKIYSKELKQLDQLETKYEAQELEIAEYLIYLRDYIDKLKIPTTDYKNVRLLTETIDLEKTINQQEIMKESQKLLSSLQVALSDKRMKPKLDEVLTKSQLFRDQKISPFSFYGYLKDLALEHDVITAPNEVGGNLIPHLNDYITYLTKVNSLDQVKLFNELRDLGYEVKLNIARNEKQKKLIAALRNINFLENFFNLKVSNEELDYYIANRDSHKVGWFKSVIDETLKGKFPNPKRNPAFRLSGYIDYNPDLIDDKLLILEDFYKTVKARDVAMVENSLKEIAKRNANVSTLIAGGFHTKGITKILRGKNYSYIVVSPYSSTDIDEENYHFLLSGKRKSLSNLVKQLNSSLRINVALNHSSIQPYNEKVVPRLAELYPDTPAEQFKIHPVEERIHPLLLLQELARIGRLIHAGRSKDDIKSIADKLREMLEGKWHWPLEPFFQEYDVRLTIDGETGVLAFKIVEPREKVYIAVDENGNYFEGTKAEEIFRKAEHTIHRLEAVKSTMLAGARREEIVEGDDITLGTKDDLTTTNITALDVQNMASRGDTHSNSQLEPFQMRQYGSTPYISPGQRKIGDGYTLEMSVPESEKKYHLRPEQRHKFIDYLYETVGIIDSASSELPATYSEVKEIVDLLLQAADLNPEYFIFHFVDSSATNAFVIRYSNHIFVNVGLVDYLIRKDGTKDALAWVLAHEITHIVQFRSDVEEGKAEFPKDWKDAAETYIASYADEYDADWRALKLLERVYEMTDGKQGFSISQASFFFKRLDEDLEEYEREYPDRPAWKRAKTKFGTHPQIKERIRRLEKIMDSLYWRSYFKEPTPFSDELIREVRDRTRRERFREDVKNMRTLEDFEDLLKRISNIDELEFLITWTYELSKSNVVYFNFNEAFELADKKVDAFIEQTPELLPYYLFIFSSLARFTGYMSIDYDQHKSLVKRSLGKLSYEQLHSLLKIKLPPILVTSTEREYFEYKYEFYGLRGSATKKGQEIKWENFMEIWIDAIMEEINKSAETQPLSAKEALTLADTLEMHRQRGKQVRPRLMETWRQYFPGNREIFHVYNFDIAWYLWETIKKDPRANKEHIQTFVEKLKVLQLSQGGNFRQAALTRPGTTRAKRYEEMLKGLRQLMEEGHVERAQYLDFVINKGSTYSRELASQYRRIEIENYPQGDLLDFTGTDIDRDLEVFMVMFASASEYFSKDMLDMLDTLASYYGLSTTERLDFLERAYSEINAAWYAEGTKEERAKKHESFYFLADFHEYLRNLVFSLQQTPEITQFLTKKMIEIEDTKNLKGLSSLSFEMKRLIYLYHIGSGIHPWTLKLVLFGRDEDNGHMLTTYALDLSAVRESEGVILEDKEMPKDISPSERDKLIKKEKKARVYGLLKADQLDDFIQEGARFWDEEKTLLQLTPEQFDQMQRGTVLKSIRAEKKGDYNYVTVGEDEFREDAKRKTFMWYDTFGGIPFDPFEYEYSSDSKMEEERSRAFGTAGAKRISDHPLYGVQFSSQDLKGFYRFLSSLPSEEGPGKFSRMKDFDARNVFVTIGNISTWEEYIAAIGIQSFLRRQGVATTNVGMQPRIFDAGEYDNVPSYYKAFVGELFELPGLEGIGFFSFRSPGRMAEKFRTYHGANPTPHVLLRYHFNDGPVDEMFEEAFRFVYELSGTLSEKVDYLVEGLPPSVFRNFALYALFLNDVLQVALRDKELGDTFDMRKTFEPDYIGRFVRDNFSFDEQIDMLEQAGLILPHIVWDKRLDAANRKDLAETAQQAVREEKIITNDEEFAKARQKERESSSDRVSRDKPQYVYIPEDFDSTEYIPYQYYIPGGVEAHIEFIIPHMFISAMEHAFKDPTIPLQEKLRHFKHLYPRASTVRDQHLEHILTATQLEPEEIKKILPLFSNETLQHRYALKALELERNLYDGRFDNAGYELERILYYFPEFGYTRDDILNDFIDRGVTHPEQLKRIQAYLLQFEDNVRREEARRRVFGRDIAKTIFEDYSFKEEQKKEFLLWILDFSDKKPDFLIILEHDYHVNFDSMRDSTRIYDGEYYLEVGRSAFEDVLEMFLFGEHGILSNKITKRDFLNQMFVSIVSDGSSDQKRDFLRKIFLSVFDHASERRQEIILKNLFVSLKRLSADEKLTPQQREAKAIAAFLESSGFVFIKLGQFLESSTLDIPPHIASELAYLKGNVDILSKGIALAAVSNVYGDFYEVFESLDEPLGGASIKSVYMGRLVEENALVAKMGKSEVVVKVKRPDVEKRIEEELRLLKQVLDSVDGALRNQGIRLPSNMIQRVKEMVEEELDFEQEYANQRELKANILAREEAVKSRAVRLASRFIKSSDYTIEVPIATEVRNNMVMVEDLAEGASLSAIELLAGMGFDSNEVSKIKGAVAEEFLKEVFIDGFYHGDLHSDNVKVSPDGKLNFIDVGFMGRLSPKGQDNMIQLLLFLNRDQAKKIPLLPTLFRFPSAGQIASILQQIPEQKITITEEQVNEIANSNESTINKMLRYLNLIEEEGAILPREYVSLSKALGSAGYLIDYLSWKNFIRVLLEIIADRNISLLSETKYAAHHLTEQKNPGSSPLANHASQKREVVVIMDGEERTFTIEDENGAEDIKKHFSIEGNYEDVEVYGVVVRVAINISKLGYAPKDIGKMLEEIYNSDQIRQVSTKDNLLYIVAADKLPNAALGGDCVGNRLVLLNTALKEIKHEAAKRIMTKSTLHHEISWHELTGLGNEAHVIIDTGRNDVEYIIAEVRREGIVIIDELKDTLSGTPLFEMLQRRLRTEVAELVAPRPSIMPEAEQFADNFIAQVMAQLGINSLDEFNVYVDSHLRPHKVAVSGFIGQNQDLRQLIIDDYLTVYGAGYAHTELASWIQSATEDMRLIQQREVVVNVRGERVRLRVEQRRYRSTERRQQPFAQPVDRPTSIMRGSQDSPLGEGTATNADYKITNLETGKSTKWFSGLMMEYIGMGFYEGHDDFGNELRYRLGPADIIEVFTGTRPIETLVTSITLQQAGKDEAKMPPLEKKTPTLSEPTEPTLSPTGLPSSSKPQSTFTPSATAIGTEDFATLMVQIEEIMRDLDAYNNWEDTRRIRQLLLNLISSVSVPTQLDRIEEIWESLRQSGKSKILDHVSGRMSLDISMAFNNKRKELEAGTGSMPGPVMRGAIEGHSRTTFPVSSGQDYLFAATDDAQKILSGISRNLKETTGEIVKAIDLSLFNQESYERFRDCIVKLKGNASELGAKIILVATNEILFNNAKEEIEDFIDNDTVSLVLAEGNVATMILEDYRGQYAVITIAYNEENRALFERPNRSITDVVVTGQPDMASIMLGLFYNNLPRTDLSQEINTRLKQEGIDTGV